MMRRSIRRPGHPTARQAAAAVVMILAGVHLAPVVSVSAQEGAARADTAIEIPKPSAPGVLPLTPQSFVPPPRSIADIASILDNEKPDLKKFARLRVRADATPGTETGKDLAQFYFDRGRARSELGRLAESIADGNLALEIGKGLVSPNLMGRYLQFVSQQYAAAGDPKKGLEINMRQLEGANVGGTKGYAFGANVKIAQIYIQMGEIEQAADYIRRSDDLIHEARTSPERGWRSSYATKGQDWESMVDNGHAVVLEARGRYGDAEQAYRASELRKIASIEPILKQDNPPAESLMRQIVDTAVLNQARMKARQGRLAEAEVDARRALLSRLKDVGKYNPVAVSFIRGFAGILLDEGRYDQAEKLTRIALDINRTIGVPDDALPNVQIVSQLGSILNLQRKYAEASAVYADLDKAIANWEPQRRDEFEVNRSRITSLYASGQVQTGIAAAERLVRRSTERVGDGHFDTASARGALAEGLMLARRDADAIREFKIAIPAMTARAQDGASDDDATVQAARVQNLQGTVEAYLALLARQPDQSSVGTETFALADSIRAGSVQQALAASSARSAARDPALAELVRKEQDLSKQVNAQLGALNNALSLSSEDRDEQSVQGLNASIDALRAAQVNARQEINRQFPAYADLVTPKSPGVAEIRAVLADDEAMLSFYFGRSGSFVWAFGKTGPVAFAAINATADEMEAKIRTLRAALEPQAAMISDIPPFDLKLAHELYVQLLQPVEAGWKQSRSIIAVTNGALGLLPLSLLPTAPAEVSNDDEPLFASYRNVPWLARTHAVTMVPSVAALRSLRQLPPGKASRGELVAFGDPIFSKDDGADDNKGGVIEVASAANVTRGLPLRRRNSPKLDNLDSADIAMLPRLPDTADELKSIALALHSDPSQVLFLGKEANEQTVKTMDLSGFKLLAFATHGLVAGELDGLTQPALALSSPTVTGKEGDGLLTMEEILALRLDADWVLLSACNTGAGAGAGAEAASGLGRAFFYAGTRALLVTNWSVHSQSARELVTDLFRRQAANPKMARGEALREAMMALIDGPGYLDAAGQTQFTYAHPLFWAPYSIIGDGGGR